MNDNIVIKNSCLNIPLRFKTEKWFLDLVKGLVRTEEDFHNPKIKNVKKYYYINEHTKHVMVPRFVPKQFINLPIEDRRSCGSDELDFLEATSEPRNEQQEETIRYMVNNENGIICLGPGEGKTAITIMALCKIKKKVIIFTHKDFLVDQWRDRFLEHSNIDKDQISRLRTKSYEDDLKYPVVLSTIQTMGRLIDTVPDLQRKLYECNFGVAVWDECHIVGAEKFSKTSLFTSSKKTFGLSATPHRSDGNDDILTYHLGNIYTPTSDDTSTMVPKIIAVMFDHGVMKYDYDWIMQYTQFDIKNRLKTEKDPQPTFSRDRYLKKIKTSKYTQYLKYMSPIIRQISKSDRKMLLLSERINLLDMLSKCCENKEEVGFFLPRSKAKRDSELKDKRLVFSTYQSCRDGVDKAEIDCLVMATPCGNWKQAIGRSVRPKNGKQQPIVIDVIDSGNEDFEKWGFSRIDKYKSEGWNVEVRKLD